MRRREPGSTARCEQTALSSPLGNPSGRGNSWGSCSAQGAGGPAGAQHISVVDAVATSQRRCHQRHHLVAGVGSAWSPAQVQAPVNQLGQAQVQGQGGRKDQPGIVDQAVVVEGDADAVGVVAWQRLFGAPFPGSVFVAKPLSQKHRSTFLTLHVADPTPSFGGFGFNQIVHRGR